MLAKISEWYDSFRYKCICVCINRNIKFHKSINAVLYNYVVYTWMPSMMRIKESRASID